MFPFARNFNSVFICQAYISMFYTGRRQNRMHFDIQSRGSNVHPFYRRHPRCNRRHGLSSLFSILMDTCSTSMGRMVELLTSWSLQGTSRTLLPQTHGPLAHISTHGSTEGTNQTSHQSTRSDPMGYEDERVCDVQNYMFSSHVQLYTCQPDINLIRI